MLVFIHVRFAFIRFYNANQRRGWGSPGRGTSLFLDAATNPGRAPLERGPGGYRISYE